MSDEKATAAKRTGKKAVAVTEAAKSKTPTTAAMTQALPEDRQQYFGGCRTGSRQGGQQGAQREQGRTTGQSSRRDCSETVEPKKVTSALKSPGPGSARPEAIEEANGASAAAKVLGEVILPARKAATSKPEGEVKPTALAAKSLIGKPAEPSNEERQRWIATAAYHRAEKRGFAPGYEVQDWLDAEAEINELIGQARSK